MKKDKKKRKKSFHIIESGDGAAIVFRFIVAIAFIVFGVYFIFLQFKENSQYDTYVTAVVTSVDDKYYRDKDEYKYRATCEYEVRGKKYTYTTSWRSRKYYKGDTIEINVNSDDPEKVNKYGKATIGAFSIFIALFVISFTFQKDYY